MKIYCGLELFIDRGANKPEANSPFREIKNFEKANDWIVDVDEMRKTRDGPGYTRIITSDTDRWPDR